MSTASVPNFKLNNGRECPVLGLGTWLAARGEVGEVVKYAIDVGYLHFDCAWIYGNEKEIGEGLRVKIQDGTVKREDLFITTKLWNTFHEEEQVVPALRESLKNFGLDYVDLYLVHWPCAMKNLQSFDRTQPFEGAVMTDYDFVRTWKGMEECVRLGLAKSIGLSNFNSKQVDRILENASIKPVMNQIEVSPLLNQKKLIKFCKDRSIHITAYSPFGSPARTWKKEGDPTLDLNDPRLVEIGKKYKKTASQVILRYVIQLGAMPIPKSSNKERLKQNITVFDFELTPEDLAVLDSFDCDGRVVPADEMKGSSEYPFKGVDF